MTTPSDDTLITATEGRRLAGSVSDMTLWRWIRAGIVPEPIVIRRRRYWRRAEFVAALNAAGTSRA